VQDVGTKSFGNLSSVAGSFYYQADVNTPFPPFASNVNTTARVPAFILSIGYSTLLPVAQTVHIQQQLRGTCKQSAYEEQDLNHGFPTVRCYSLKHRRRVGSKEIDAQQNL
jgi:hypothetical protein